MSKHLEFLTPVAVAEIVGALGDAYYDNGQIYNPDIGNTPLSYAIAVWQSSLYNLEQRFDEVPGVQRCLHMGNVFYIEFEACRVYFYKFPVSEKAESFRLNRASRTRERIIENNKMSLFNYTMNPTAQPQRYQQLIVIHTGTPDEGLLEAHIGAPISENRADDGWLWPLEEIYNQQTSGTYTRQEQKPPVVQPFNEMAEPAVDLEMEIEDRDDEQDRQDK